MKKFLQGLAIGIVSAVSLALPTSVALGAFTQFGMPGIYNASNFTLTNGQGSAISTDAQGRALISPSSSISSLTIGTLNATTGTFSNLTVTVLNTSSQFSYVPVNTTTHAARVFIQGAGTENPFTIASSTNSTMITVLNNNALEIGGNLDFGFADSGASTGVINQFGFNGGLTQTRSLRIDDGTGGSIARFNGGSELTELFGSATIATKASVGTSSLNNTLTVQGTGAVNPFAILSSTAAGTSMLTMLTNGNLGIGSSTPLTKLAVVGDVNISNLITNIATDNLVCVSATGTLSQEAVSCTVSSARFKENIKSMSTKQMADKVRKLRAVSFDYRAKDLNGQNQIPDHGLNGGGKASTGFIAEEVALIDPMLVVFTSDYSSSDLAFVKKNYPNSILYKGGKVLIPQTVDYARVSVLLTGAYQDLDARVSRLENSIAIKWSFWDRVITWIKSLFR